MKVTVFSKMVKEFIAEILKKYSRNTYLCIEISVNMPINTPNYTCDLDLFPNIQLLHVATNFDMNCYFFCVSFLPIANVEINFGEDPTGDMVCQGTPQCIQEDLCGWSGMTITARESTTFRVVIGPSGGLRGYEYITGKV